MYPSVLRAVMNGTAASAVCRRQARLLVGACHSVRRVSNSTFDFEGKSRVDVLRLQQQVKDHDKDCSQLPDSIRRYLFYHKGRPLVNKTDFSAPVLLDHDLAQQLHAHLDKDAVFLRFCSLNNQAFFAVTVPKTWSDGDVRKLEDDHGAEFSHLRLNLLAGRDHEASVLLTQGFSLLKWHRNTGFCSKCGHVTVKSTSGSRRICTNKEECGTVHFPSTAPVGIVLVAAYDHSKVVLIRQPKYPEGMYSCIAGFVDVGESLFDCVQREVAEEAGILIEESKADLRLLGSQHWPFPNGSLMLGCMVLADPSSTPRIDDHGEIEHARWFTMEEVKEAVTTINANPNLRLGSARDDDVLNGQQLFVPPKGALANFMLTQWLEKQHNIVID